MNLYAPRFPDIPGDFVGFPFLSDVRKV